MSNLDIWPVVFVVWKTKGEEALQAINQGQITAKSGKAVHARKNAQFIAIREDGAVLAIGQISNITKWQFDLNLTALATDINNLPQLSKKWLEKVKAVPNGFIKFPISALIVPPGKENSVFDGKWFLDVYNYGLKNLPSVTAQAVKTAKPEPVPPPPGETTKPEPVLESKKKKQGEKPDQDTLLRSWIPPALTGLLQDHVRADQWEIVVAEAFQALGFKVQLLGQNAKGKAVPDCIAAYTSPTGQILELVVDAKAGHWSGAIDDIRAMQDYHSQCNTFTYPIFVANSLSKDIGEKLRDHVMQSRTPSAISGRDLALLICQRLTNPGFNIEMA
jgi:hypothetical protein